MSEGAAGNYAPSIPESAAISIATVEARALSMRRQMAAHGPATLDDRLDRLSRLERAISNHAEMIAQAIEQDFGVRGRLQSILSDVYEPLSAARAARHQTRLATVKTKIRLSFPFNITGRAYLEPQPAGLVGAITPASDPIRLSLLILVDALAAGNRIILKPSENTPASAHLLDRMLASEFDADEVSIITGDAQVAIALAKMPIDHLIAVGSRPTLSAIMAAAATNLTPVTLVPGGKTAALVAPDYPTAEAADQIINAKLINAGQSCEAPDYALVAADKLDEFVRATEAAIANTWDRLEAHPDYAAIPSAAHRKRLQALVRDAVEKGARIVSLGPSGESFGPEQTKMRPALLLNVTDEMDVLHEEIMGPLLPVLAYESLEDAVQFVNAGERALTLSLFSHTPSWRRQILARTHIGGLVINDVGPGARPASLPFGVENRGSSGAVGGIAGMMGLTRLTPVFERFRLSVLPRTRLPFTAQDEATIDRLVRRGR